MITMDGLDGEAIVVSNVMEEIVDAKLNSFMAETDMCKCPLCRSDVLALALNHLQPKYVATVGGNVMMHMMANTTQMLAEITVALTDATTLVSNRPRHGPEATVK